VNCPSCKKEVAADSYFCLWCSRFLPAPEIGIKAGLFSRWVAWVIDPLLAFLLWGVAVTVLASFAPELGALGAIVFPLGYSLWFLVLFGEGLTPGKKLLGLQVVHHQTGEIPGFITMFLREIVGRFLSGLFFGLGYFWAIIDKNAQAWHDKLAGTVVVKTGKNRLAATFLVMAVAVPAVCGIGVVLSTTFREGSFPSSGSSQGTVPSTSPFSTHRKDDQINNGSQSSRSTRSSQPLSTSDGGGTSSRAQTSSRVGSRPMDRERRYAAEKGQPVEEIPGEAVAIREQTRADFSKEQPTPIRTEDQWANRRGQAIELSLRWLASHQNPEGYWDADGFSAMCPSGDRCDGPAGRVKIDEEGVDRQNAGKNADSGITALALLAFLGGGYTHEEGMYADQIDRSLSWMIRQQRSNGDLGGQATHFERMYCHAIATYALAAAVSIAHDPASQGRLLEPLRRAVAYSLDNQNPDGGWRYTSGQSSDMSVFGWQLIALRCAEVAGVSISDSAKAKMVQFLKDRSLGQNRGLAGYRLVGGQPQPESESMTAAAFFGKQMLGITRENPSCTEASNYLVQRLPRPSRHNLYYWYFGTLAMNQYGGDQWRQWNEALHDAIIPAQRQTGHAAGSWDPLPPWGEYGGRIFSTAESTLCLEVSNQYLPVYKVGRN